MQNDIDDVRRVERLYSLLTRPPTGSLYLYTDIAVTKATWLHF